MLPIDQRTLEQLRLIQAGLRWTASSRWFTTADYKSALITISTRLYEKVGWESQDFGPVVLTAEGQRRLTELEGEEHVPGP